MCLRPEQASYPVNCDMANSLEDSWTSLKGPGRAAIALKTCYSTSYRCTSNSNSKENLERRLLEAQQIQAQRYNKGAWEKVSCHSSPIRRSSSWPNSKDSEVLQQVGKVHYEIHRQDKMKKHQIFHINVLKHRCAQEILFIDPRDLPVNLTFICKSQQVLKMC